MERGAQIVLLGSAPDPKIQVRKLPSHVPVKGPPWSLLACGFSSGLFSSGAYVIRR